MNMFSIHSFCSRLLSVPAACSLLALLTVPAVIFYPAGSVLASQSENAAKTTQNGKTPTSLQGPDQERVRSVMSLAQKLYDQREFERSRAMVRELADEGSVEAMFAMALMEARGNGNNENRPDFAKAREWWEKAAARGDVESMYNLGLVYYRGVQNGGDGSDPDRQDFTKAREWWLKAAGHGHLKAIYSLAGMARTGEGQPKNFEEAFKWYFQAAEAGHPDSQFQVGSMYLNGKGVAKDAALAEKWMRKAAEGQHPGAVNALRLMKMQEAQQKK